MKLTGRVPRRATAAVAVSTLVVAVVGVLAPGHAAMSPPPSSSIGATASDPAATTTTVPLTLENGIFTVPDGSLSVAFSAVPTLSIDTENNVVSYLLGDDGGHPIDREILLINDLKITIIVAITGEIIRRLTLDTCREYQPQNHNSTDPT